MALKKTVTTPHGFVATDAYHRVEGVHMHSKSEIAFQVRSYKDESCVAHFSDISFVCKYDLNKSNPIAQAYDHVKSQEAFSDTQDC